MALTCRKTLLLASSNRCLGHNIMGYKWGSITVLRRPSNRPDAQLLESATVV